MVELTAEYQQFQVGVRIIEAKDLAGTEISPFVEITVGRQQKKTKVRNKTVSPYFDEVNTFFSLEKLFYTKIF